MGLEKSKQKRFSWLTIQIQALEMWWKYGESLDRNSPKSRQNPTVLSRFSQFKEFASTAGESLGASRISVMLAPCFPCVLSQTQKCAQEALWRLLYPHFCQFRTFSRFATAPAQKGCQRPIHVRKGAKLGKIPLPENLVMRNTPFETPTPTSAWC